MIGTPEWVDGELAAAYGITKRQREVLVGMALGWTNEAIGRHLGVTDNTVRTHTRRVFALLRVQCRASAVACAYDGGLLRTRAMRNERARARARAVSS